MSMLAERKQKQRWYLNPRANKEWVQDTNKFGQRMLEKMGWTSGKGLGKNEDGVAEHIKIKYKNDVEGIGYELRDDQWTQHENNFTQLLANLSNGDASKLDKIKPEKSLEKKSQASRARVHYHKFTRMKDLTIRSEKDLANIFGRKTLDKPVVKEEKVESDNKDELKFGVVTIKSGNMADYFKSKLGKLGDKLSSDTIKKDDYESEIGSTAGFGFNNNKETFPQNEEQNGIKRKRDETDDEIVPKKKKKNKKKVAFDNPGNDINIAEEVCYNNPCLNEEVGLDNPCFNDDPENKQRKSVTFASPLAEYSTISDDSPKKKRKKKKNIGIDNPACEEIEETKQEETNRKKKRKSIDSLEEEITPKKSKKKKKNSENGIENLACTEISPDKQEFLEISPVKKSKKKKKSAGITNLACEESTNCADNLGCSVNLIEEGIENITNAIDNYQTELENEINEKKVKKKSAKRCK